MAKYHIKIERSELEMTHTTEKEQKQRKTKAVSVKLSSGALTKIKKIAGIQKDIVHQISQICSITENLIWIIRDSFV